MVVVGFKSGGAGWLAGWRLGGLQKPGSFLWFGLSKQGLT